MTKARKFIKIIEDQSNRLINLVENMLSVSKLQDEHSDIVMKLANIKPVIETVIIVVKNSYPTHKFILEHNENIPQILIDKDKFQQIMTNLIENAAKYSDENSTVTIKTAIFGDYVSVKVTDKGIGILPENYNRIFTKFSRIDNPLTRKVQGSGLGLYITKTLVEKMNGKISVMSGG